eukprot:3937447-Prymnesium_polylepis.2
MKPQPSRCLQYRAKLAQLAWQLGVGAHESLSEGGNHPLEQCDSGRAKRLDRFGTTLSSALSECAIRWRLDGQPTRVQLQRLTLAAAIDRPSLAGWGLRRENAN